MVSDSTSKLARANEVRGPESGCGAFLLGVSEMTQLLKFTDL